MPLGVQCMSSASFCLLPAHVYAISIKACSQHLSASHTVRCDSYNIFPPTDHLFVLLLHSVSVAAEAAETEGYIPPDATAADVFSAQQSFSMFNASAPIFRLAPKPLTNFSIQSSFANSLSKVLGDRRKLARIRLGRKMQEIISPDDRDICPVKKYPFSAIGQIEVVDNTGLYICTGTLIAPDKVLTAGHCVWNTRRGAFYYNLNFAPGRYRSGDKMINPWGTVAWKSVTVFEAFKQNPNSFDVAVVTLQKPIGSVAGTMGIAAGCAQNKQLFLGGYPQDKPQGTCQDTVCTQSYLDCNKPMNTHYCDTVMGMSGSPMWDSSNKIRMIHVAGLAGKNQNRATTMTKFLVNALKKW